MNLICAVMPGGALLCADCTNLEAEKGTDLSSWWALTADEVRDQGNAMFDALLPDAAGLYPDMDVDPRMIAQLEALPVCDTCGVALAKVKW